MVHSFSFMVLLETIWTQVNPFVTLAIFCAFQTNVSGFSSLSLARTISTSALQIFKKFRPVSASSSLIGWFLDIRSSLPFPCRHAVFQYKLLGKLHSEFCLRLCLFRTSSSYFLVVWDLRNKIRPLAIARSTKNQNT